MNRHSHIRGLLFDYAKGGLPSDQAAKVEEHIAACKSCASEVKELRTLHEQVEATLQAVPERLPKEYWDGLPAEVLLRIGRPDRQVAVEPSWLDKVLGLFELKPLRYVAALGCAVAMLFAVVLVWQWIRSDRPVEHVSTTKSTFVGSDSLRIHMAVVPVQRVGQYFSRSRVLLVGLTNMDLPRGEPLDISIERQASHELAEEAKYLKDQPLDIRSAKLIDEMEKIFVEIADVNVRSNTESLELIRQSIHRQNLLFKVRMAETLYDSTLVASAQSRLKPVEGNQK